MTEVWLWVAIAGLTVITIVSRSFFMLSREPWPMPGWLREALKVAPLAALVAVIAPEVFMTQGQLITTLKDPRWPAVLAATACYFWKRDILGTIAVGMAVLLTLRLGLGW